MVNASGNNKELRRADSRALVVFSGGQDSTTCLYWAKQRFGEIVALTFFYGQRHSIEIESARKIAELAGVRHEILDLGSIFSGLSSLTDSSQSIPESALDDVALKTLNQNAALPSTFVPGRNILFLSLAASRAYAYQCDTVVIGVSQEDYAGYPDCRESFIRSMEAAIQAGLDKPIQIAAPLLHLTKKETVALASEIPGCLEAVGQSTTCYNGVIPPCRKCNACRLRARGFEQAGIVDPLIERCEKSEVTVNAR